MTDPREHKANDRVAHESLRGQLNGVTFTAGEMKQVITPVADLLASSNGALNRQLLHGDLFCVLEEHNQFAFGFEKRSEYVGYVRMSDLETPDTITHWISTMGANVYPEPSIKSKPIMALPFAAHITCYNRGTNFWETRHGFVPFAQTRMLSESAPDFTTTAQFFFGVPYLWGGDTNWGLDCSGLVNIALRVSDLHDPRDSDQQEEYFGDVPRGEPRKRGDLVFWPGHVGIFVNRGFIIHASAHHMSVMVEDVREVRDRIKWTEGKKITKYGRWGAPSL